MGKYLGALITVVLGAAVVIGLIVTLGAYSTQPAVKKAVAAPAVSSTGNYTKTASINLQTLPASGYTDPEWLQKHGADTGPIPPAAPHQDWVMYWPTTQLVVPAHALVTVKIINWDSKSPLLNPFYAIPQGIYGNSLAVDGKTKTQIDPADVSHTFTIHTIPDKQQSYLYVSVPITGVPDDAKTDDAGFPLTPVVTTFQFVTGGPGEYIWQCVDPCGTAYNSFGGPMQTRGWMSGTVIVTG